ncbi:hypothetical protein PUNSTDRAFT_139506 [Punctularia strigosozonata HHB-11173 SS5]|uniref:Uncharacterized protein n=1 Tax=Punctularia strigosozonata (strain HHB-11173) TaxID=741275 RepID=R7S142_PUNST|nr:uncharacterized protein PUNSTDRAFT_139506 [Punctularia strigosozonata HHB-11173 SS5]EIN03512.1 hypothetical protein PUNSTDRAFT_139506 [Punctularia strigosozonata HHB-11173 SS5]
MALSELQYTFVQLFCAVFVWGMYTTLMMVLALVLALGSRSLTKPRLAMFGVGVLMYLVASCHTSIVFSGFISGPNNRDNAKLLQSTIILAQIQFILYDIVLIWRVWVIWGHLWWAIAPQIVSLIVSCGLTFQVAAAVTSPNARVFPVASAALTLANTILSTLLIVCRLEYMQYRIRKVASGVAATSSGQRYTGIVMMFVESGAIVTAAQIISFILQQINSPALHVVLNMLPQILGLFPTSIILLVHLDMVPGSRESQRYAQTFTSHSLRWATATGRSTTSAPITWNTGSATAQGSRLEFKQFAGEELEDPLPDDDNLSRG